MPRFRSGLETLLKMRERAEDAARQELAEAARRKEHASAELDAVGSELQAQAEALCDEGACIPLMLLQAGHARCGILNGLHQEKQNELEQVSAEHECAREAVITARRELKTAEKLHARAQEAHLVRARRKESKALDESRGGPQAATNSGHEMEGEPPWLSGSTE